jgi:hypothetical protein
VLCRDCTPRNDRKLELRQRIDCLAGGPAMLGGSQKRGLAVALDEGSPHETLSGFHEVLLLLSKGDLVSEWIHDGHSFLLHGTIHSRSSTIKGKVEI